MPKTATLSEVFAVLARDDWAWALSVHARALEAAFREREQILSAIEIDSIDSAELQSIATVMTSARNLEAVVEELAACSQLSMG
jgi:hypothetical protein